MISNPELRRNLWLNFSLPRLILMPLVISLLIVLVWYQTGDTGSSLSPSRHMGLQATITGLFFAIMVFWGFNPAGSSIMMEIQDGTWDQQRMSALSPWTMTWGKLLGSTAYAWYGGGLCLLALILISISSGQITPANLAIQVGIWVTFSLWGMALSLLSSFTGLGGQHTGTYGMLAAILTFPPFFILLQKIQYMEDLTWWAFTLPANQFILLSLCFFLLCTVFAIWRSMCGMLQVRTLPWAFPLFLALISLYIAGFFIEEDAWSLLPFLLGGTSFLATYAILILHNPGERVEITWKRLLHYGQNQQWRKFLETLPLWPITLLMLVFCTLLSIVIRPEHSFSIKFTLDQWSRTPEIVVLGTATLVALRDICVYLFLALSRNAGKKTNYTLMLYLIIAHFVLPSFAFTMPLLQGIIQPLSFSANFIVTFLAASGQVLISMGLVYWKIRQLQKQ